MPLALTYAEPATFTVRASGRVTYHEVQDLFAQILAHPRLCYGVQVLVDSRGVTGAPSTSELRDIAREMKPLLDGGLGPVAVLADSTFMYGVVRMFSIFAEMMNARVAPFRAEVDAQQWLAMQAGTGVAAN